MKELQPVNQHVLLDLADEKEQKTKSGIIIPGTVKEKKNIAKVIAMSFIDNAEIAVGETVIFNEFAGKEIDFDGKKFLLVPYNEILAKVVETDKI